MGRAKKCDDYSWRPVSFVRSKYQKFTKPLRTFPLDSRCDWGCGWRLCFSLAGKCQQSLCSLAVS